MPLSFLVFLLQVLILTINYRHTEQKHEQVSWKQHYWWSSWCSLPELSSLGQVWQHCPADTASVSCGNDEHSCVCHQLAFTRLLAWGQLCPVGHKGQRERRHVAPTWRATQFYLYSQRADKLHYTPADKKQPGHFCCKAETHPCLGTWVTDSPHSPSITSANSTQRNYRH